MLILTFTDKNKDDYNDCVFYATLADAPVTLDQDTACFASAENPRALALLSTSDDDNDTDDDDDDSYDDDDADDNATVVSSSSSSSSSSKWYNSKELWAFVGFALAIAFFLYAVRRYRSNYTSIPDWASKGTEEEPLISA
jgi:hypothetical protein